MSETPSTAGPDIAELLADRLASARQVTTLVGDRIRPNVLDQNDRLPAIRYETSYCDTDYSLAGESGSASTRIKIDAFGATRREANLVAQAAHDVLGGLSQITLGEDEQAAHVFDCQRVNSYDQTDQPVRGGDVRYRRVQEYQVAHTILVPSLELE